MIRTLLTALITTLPFAALADDDLRHYCGGTTYHYDVVVVGDTTRILRSAEVRQRCTIEADAMTCDNGAEFTIEFSGDDLILEADFWSSEVILSQRKCN